jgi:hypothetical protein
MSAPMESRPISSQRRARLRWTYALSFTLFSLMMAAVGCAGAESTITVQELMSDREGYQGELVSVVGYAMYGFESCVLFASDPETHEDGQRHAIWYQSADCMLSADSVRAGHAIVTGVFNGRNPGHLAAYDSTIERAVIEWIE